MNDSIEWKSRPLLDLLALVLDYRGRTPKKLGMEWGGGDIPALSANNVEMGRINFSKECYFGAEVLYRKWMTRGDAQFGDVVLTTEAPLGNVAQIPDSNRYILSQRAILLRANETDISNDYLAHYLRSEYFQTLMQQQSSGTTATGIQRKKLETLSIRFPADNLEQRKIAEILSIVDRAIKQTEALIAKQERIKTGLMQDLLTRGIDEHGNLRSESTHEFKDSPLGRIPVEWDVKKVVELSTKVTDGDHHTPIRSESGFYLLSARNVNNGFLSLVDVDYVTTTEFERMSRRCNPEAGDILVSCSGTIGRICEVPAWLKCVLVRSAALIKFNRELVVSRFAEWAMRSFGVQLQILSAQRQAAQPNLFQGEIENLQLPTPSLLEQVRISSALDGAQKDIDCSHIAVLKLRSLKTALMQDLLTGRKSVAVLLQGSTTH